MVHCAVRVAWAQCLMISGTLQLISMCVLMRICSYHGMSLHPEVAELKELPSAAGELEVDCFD